MTDGSIRNAPEFLVGQDRIGYGVALASGSTLFALEPAAALAAIVNPATVLTRRRRRRS